MPPPSAGRFPAVDRISTGDRSTWGTAPDRTECYAATPCCNATVYLASLRDVADAQVEFDGICRKEFPDLLLPLLQQPAGDQD